MVARGALAVGVDLNPDEYNQWVVTGDFHALQYADGSFSHAYSNVVDHVLDLSKFIEEVHRVLRGDTALWIVDIYRGHRETGKIDSWGALLYDSADDIVARIVSTGLFSVERHLSPFSNSYLSVVFLRRPRRSDGNTSPTEN